METTTRCVLRLVAITTALSLVACSSQLSSPDRPPAGASAEFRTGYTLGCTAGRSAVEPIVVESRLPKDASEDTKRGWDLGYQTCFNDAVRHGSPLTNRGSGT